MIKEQTFVERELEYAIEDEESESIAYWSLAKAIIPEAKDEWEVDDAIMDRITDGVHDNIIYAVNQEIERLFEHHGIALPEDFFGFECTSIFC